MTAARVMGMVPKSKKAAIREVYIDSDGIWVILNEGWNADGMDSRCRTIHCGDEEDVDSVEVVQDLKYQIGCIRKL